MTESYLHFLWKMKRLPFHQLKTTSGKNVLILQHGIHNQTESGPDFFNAHLVYENLQWVGQIEMHVKSSDWYLHNHHLDKAYNNVVLHVVYEHDCEVILNKSFLPTIELKPYIDQAHYQHWQRFSHTHIDIPCIYSLPHIDPIFMRAMLHRVIVDRLNRKTKEFFTIYHQMDNSAFLYYLIARAFGTKTNTVPFEQLVQHLPLSVLKSQKRHEQRQLILQTSGVFSTIPKNKNEQSVDVAVAPQTLSPAIWKHKGLRPSAFPKKRVFQFSEFIMQCNVEQCARYSSPKEAQANIEQIISNINAKESNLISKNLLNLLYVNAFVLYYWIKSYYTDQGDFREDILSFLETIAPEDNVILRRWNELGVHAKNAYESQGLIELYNQHCQQRKCLNCQVGVKILNK